MIFKNFVFNLLFDGIDCECGILVHLCPVRPQCVCRIFTILVPKS